MVLRLPEGYVLNVLDARPSANISLRTVEAESIKVLQVPEMVQIDQMDKLHAIWEVFEGAIFMHQGETYLIRNLDLGALTAHAQRVSVDYFTRSRDRKGEVARGRCKAARLNSPSLRCGRGGAAGNGTQRHGRFLGQCGGEDLAPSASTFIDSNSCASPGHRAALWLRQDQGAQPAHH